MDAPLNKKSSLAHAIIDDKLTTICAFFEAGVFYARNQNYTTENLAWQKRGVPAELQTTHIFNKYIVIKLHAELFIFFKSRCRKLQRSVELHGSIECLCVVKKQVT